MNPFILVASIVVTLVIGVLIGYIFRKIMADKTIGSAELTAKNLILDAENQVVTIKKEIRLEAKEDAQKIKLEAEKEVKERRIEISKAENRLAQKEE